MTATENLSRPINPDINAYAFEHSSTESELLQELAVYTRENAQIPEMLCGRVEGQFLKMMVGALEARRVLELGTFTGYSALSMAEALPEGGSLITCDCDPVALKIARKFFDRSPHGRKIQIVEGPAFESLDQIQGSFDLAFVDADKIPYPQYFQRVIEMVRPGGFLLFDNVLYSGRVLHPQSEAEQAICELNRMVRDDPRVDSVLLTVRDGILCIRKK